MYTFELIYHTSMHVLAVSSIIGTFIWVFTHKSYWHFAM